MNKALTAFFFALAVVGAILVGASFLDGHLTLGASGFLIGVPSAVVAFSIMDRGDPRSLLERALGERASQFRPPALQPEPRPGKCVRCGKRMRAGLLAFDEQWCAKGCGAWVSAALPGELHPVARASAPAPAPAPCPGCGATLTSSTCERCGGRWLDQNDIEAIAGAEARATRTVS